ncbi:MAG: glycoside hydrolase family 57, partial [Kordiimonas sp.]
MSIPIAYTVFHMNMAFSSIEEEERPAVVERCYWPLLELAKSGLPIGIEATSYTLRAINDIAPEWVVGLRSLIEEGAVEFIGSGYSQMIAPLIPSEVTRRNLQIGLEDYVDLLGMRPNIALVNEQAYSPGIVPLYIEAGYSAIMMDCSEPASHSRSWHKSYSRLPQKVRGENGSEIAVLWSDAISFQKFQRYAHGELDADEYFEFLSLQVVDGVQAFPLYTSDAEVFDYRPGRFASEARQETYSEYARIRYLMEALARSNDVDLALPSKALSLLNNSSTPLHLESAAAPVPVKKQRKYNLLRWGVSGKNDLKLNTHCWRMYYDLCRAEESNVDAWRVLCGFWASDFRTHITDSRWVKLNQTLPPASVPNHEVPEIGAIVPSHVAIEERGRFLKVETGTHHLVLNTHRGLAIQALGVGKSEGSFAGAPSANSFIGTLDHGHYQDIAFGADFYSGHFIFEPSGRHKVADLMRVDPVLGWSKEKQAVVVQGILKSPWGDIRKVVFFYVGTGKVEISYKGAMPLQQDGSFRVGHVTLNPRAFDQKSLYYASHNGGDFLEKHNLYDDGLVEFDHGASVSRLVSATT